MDKAALSLTIIQQRFAQALLNVDLVERTLPLFAASTSSLDARMAFYRGNLASVWSGALANAYPVLLQLVGAEFFAQMARAYGQAYPSQLGDLNHFGSELPQFLANAPMTADYPYFVDVAALEWKVHRAYYAADADIFTLPALIACAGDKLQSVCLNWHPASRLHESDNASVPVWLAHQASDDERKQFSLSDSSYGLITRPEWHVSVLLLSWPAFQALNALSQQKTLGEALEIALALDSQFDIPGQLNAWFSAGAFSGIDCSEE